MHFPLIFNILGWLLTAFGLTMFVPAIISAFSQGMAVDSFVVSGCITIFFGVMFVFMTAGSHKILSHRDAFLMTFLAWFALSLFGSFPLYYAEVVPTFADAFFESVSGLTTTGASVMSGLDKMDYGILFWRALLQWLGGMGVVVLATAIIPFLGVGGMQLYKAEMPGVEKDKLQPRLKETASLLWGVYMILTLACATLYKYGGMSGFDAICHAFTTVATGGYSNHDASMGYFDSPFIEGVCIAFMLLGAFNFGLHFLFLQRRSFKVYYKNTELRLFFAILAGIILIVAVRLTGAETGYETFGESLRHTMFNFTAVMTTTGYATQDYSQWPLVASMLVMVLMFIGGCSGSTAGGMKVLRIMLISKQGMRELKKMIHPHAIVHLKLGGRHVHDKIVQAVWSFAGLYIISFIVIASALSLHDGLDLVTAFSAAAATITGLGPALGDLGPASNYGGLQEQAKYLLCFSMLLGRLELFTLLVILTPDYWRK
ncbi:MAG: potassium transporter [Magnetococcales bacterium]|nr:potassium transporter [Magnetococcales bacterium]|tara:strand:- start:17585 stop:19042 length:1458 start_codon:yes stop_codon:yes gene_type:complete